MTVLQQYCSKNFAEKKNELRNRVQIATVHKMLALRRL